MAVDGDLDQAALVQAFKERLKLKPRVALAVSEEFPEGAAPLVDLRTYT